MNTKIVKDMEFFFPRETWSVALKVGVTLKAVEKVMGQMFVSVRNEGTGGICIM